MHHIRLVRLTRAYEKQLREMLEEWRKDLEENGGNASPRAIFRQDERDFDAYLANLECRERTPDGRVPDSVLFCLDEERDIFVGAVNIRHELNEGLLLTGGHIGDGIRPSERRKGYATEMLALALEECRKLGIEKVLMTCDKNNIGSAKSIIRNGGTLENEVPKDGVTMQRYWIDLDRAERGRERMDERRIEMLESAYGRFDEDARLIKSRHGQLEYLTTMHQIHQFARPGCRVLEIGAGTGRYAIALAREGYAVSAVELVQSNLDILRGKAEGLENLDACQGDALDLGRFQDGSFGLTLLLGPMYHLYSPEDQRRALDEALRVTRPGGILMAAFLSVHAIVYTNYLYGDPPLGFGLKENFDAGYKTRHFPGQLFTGFDIPEFEALFEGMPIRRLATVSADGMLELAERSPDFSMTDEEFRSFSAYHLEVCARRELLGGSSHLLYIGRKKESA